MAKKVVTKKTQSNNIFDNISESLDTSFDGEEVQELVDVKNQALKCQDISSDVFLDDEDYIRTELMSLISTLEVAIDKMQQNLKIGSHARDNEVFGQLCNAKVNAVKELTAMNKAKLDAKVKLNKVKISQNMNVTNNIMSSSDLLKFVNDASKNSSLKGIKAKFKIEDEKFK